MEIVENIILFCVFLCLLLVPILFIGRVVEALFSRRTRLEIRKQWVLYAIWLVVSVLFVGLLVPAGPSLGTARRAKTHNIEEQIRVAIRNYTIEYGVPPPGKDNAGLIKELEGENPRAIPFLNLRSTDKNAKGEVLDAWGIPLQITMTDPRHPVIKSVAPDKFIEGVNKPDESDDTSNPN